MSDFINDGWSWYVAIVTIVSLVACLVLLMIASRRKVMAEDNSTGHVWDVDLREMNNPLPRWWVWLFIITVLFSFLYLFLYPGLGSMAGGLKWTSEGQLAAEQKVAAARMQPLYTQFAGQSAEQLVKNAQAMGTGERLFGNHCAQCHGADAKGSKGFPNLTDNDWLHGGSFEKIKETITVGRTGSMPPLAAAVGSAADVRNVAHHVLSLSKSAHDNVAAQLGQAKFVVCAACHGADGKGNPALGAPNLTDGIWLHGWGEQAIVQAVSRGISNVMPAQAGVLSPEQIHVLAAYVWGLSQAPLAGGAGSGG
jgi:cytochrome c oxidase cbb3-type subunit 3